MVARLFVGGLPQDITQADLHSRFSPFGRIESIDIIAPKTDQATSLAQASAKGSCRGFAYVEIHPKDDVAVHKCLSVYNHSKWRGSVLRVELAKPSYLAKLHVEWRAQAQSGIQAEDMPEKGQRQEVPASSLTPPVSEAALAAAEAASAAAAAKRAKAASRSTRPLGPVPPPEPTDLCQPINLPNPHDRRQPLVVDLLHPAVPPRRHFPPVAPLPLSRLEWQRDEDFNEGNEGSDSGNSDSGSSSDGEAGGAHRRPMSAPPAGAVAVVRSAKRRHIAGEASGTVAAAAAAATTAKPPSVLYYLNRVMAVPMVRSSAAAEGTTTRGGAVMQTATTDPSSRDHQQQQQQVLGSRAGVGTAVPPPKQLAVTTAAEGAPFEPEGAEGSAALTAVAGAAPAAGPKREVRGEMLSMFKVLKSIDSESRKRSAEEAAERLTADKAAAARRGHNATAGRVAQLKQLQWGPRDGEPLQLLDVATFATAAAATAAGAGGVVDFMDEDDNENVGVGIGAGGMQQHQQLVLDRFADSDGDDAGDTGGYGGAISRGQGQHAVTGSAGRGIGGSSGGLGLARGLPAGVPKVSLPALAAAAAPSDQVPVRGSTGKRLDAGTWEVGRPLTAAKKGPPSPEQKDGGRVASAAKAGPHTSVVAVATPAPATMPTAAPQPSKRARSAFEADGGSPAGRQPRQAGAADAPLVPLRPPAHAHARNRRRGGVDAVPAKELLDRFGGGSDSEGEEVFRDVDDSDTELGGGQKGPRKRSAVTQQSRECGAVAAAAPPPPRATDAIALSARHGAVVSFLDNEDEDTEAGAGGGPAARGDAWRSRGTGHGRGQPRPRVATPSINQKLKASFAGRGGGRRAAPLSARTGMRPKAS